MTRPRLALLPLDDRPPNLQFPRRLAAIGSIALRLPPKRLLGRFLRPGDTEALAEWLEHAAGAADGLIVSCDMLAYGGLVASRTTAGPLCGRPAAQAAARLRRLHAIKRRFARLPVYAFAVIPRLGLTASAPAVTELGPALARYGELRHRREALTEGEADELARLAGALPRDVIAAHGRMRRRNLAVNRRLVGLAAQGDVDFVVLAQEDAPPSGPHIAEQAKLMDEARRLGVAERVRIYPGADEVGLALLARAAGRLVGVTGGAYPLYSTPGGAEAVALFEDRPLRVTVAGQIEAAGLEIAPTEEAADIVLGLHSPPGAAQTDINHITPDSAPRPPFVEHLAELARAGREVALADVAYCNGADPALVSALGDAKTLPHLAAFAGWNTAGNTIGTALAQAALKRIGVAVRECGADRRQNAAMRAHLEFLFERLVDDYGYETVVRREAYRFAREMLRQWPLNLRRERRRAAEYVRAELEPLARRLFAQHFEGAAVNGQRIAVLRDLRIALPWPRLFEVEVEARVAAEETAHWTRGPRRGSSRLQRSRAR